MTTYEIIPFSQANPAEKALLVAVSKAAREIASHKISHQREPRTFDRELEAAKALDLSGVRLGFLETQMELADLHGKIDHTQSAYARLVDEAENIIYGAALAFAEDYFANAARIVAKAGN